MTGFTNSHSMKGKDHFIPTPQGAEVVAYRTTLSVLAADLVQNYIDQVATLPAGCVPIDIEYDITDPDSSTAALVLSFSIGNRKGYDAAGAVSAGTAADTLASTVAADGGGVWGVTTATTASATAKIAKTGVNMANVTAVDYDRHIVAVVTTAPTTAAACTLGITLTYRNKLA
jgi:hypothetical protein